MPAGFIYNRVRLKTIPLDASAYQTSIRGILPNNITPQQCPTPAIIILLLFMNGLGPVGKSDAWPKACRIIG